jgi:hypothetical protein
MRYLTRIVLENPCFIHLSKGPQEKFTRFFWAILVPGGKRKWRVMSAEAKADRLRITGRFVCGEGEKAGPSRCELRLPTASRLGMTASCELRMRGARPRCDELGGAQAKCLCHLLSFVLSTRHRFSNPDFTAARQGISLRGV